MSFSVDVKNEIIENRPLRLRYKRAQAYGLFLFAKSFTSQDISLITEMTELAGLYEWFLREFCPKEADIRVGTLHRRGRTLYQVRLVGQESRECLLEQFPDFLTDERSSILTSPEQVQAFLTGAWLACGNVSDPEKSYHLEFVCRSSPLCDALQTVMESCVSGVRRTTRRGADILYLKGCTDIEDMLAMIGASKNSLAMIEVEIIKTVRNRANRVTNCETANIDKTVSASASQVEDIRLILDTQGADWLPENLREVAFLRLEYPDLSLRELMEISPFSISRSGMHHRLNRLSGLAESIRKSQKEAGHSK